MSADGKDDIANIVVLHVRDLLAEADNDFVTSAAVLVFIVAVEFVVTHHPYSNFVIISVTRDQYLYKQ